MQTTINASHSCADIALLRTSLQCLYRSLDKIVSLPDAEAATMLEARLRVWDDIDQLHERSYSERGLIAREFERRQLWRHLGYDSFSAWMSSGDLGCRSVNYESKRDMEALSDLPAEVLVEVPRNNVKTLLELSTRVRRREDIQLAARTMKNPEFLAKISQEHPDQHLEGRKMLRFNPERSGARIVEEAIRWAIDHDLAGSRDEALVTMAQTALEDWEACEVPAGAGGGD